MQMAAENRYFIVTLFNPAAICGKALLALGTFPLPFPAIPLARIHGRELLLAILTIHGLFLPTLHHLTCFMRCRCDEGAKQHQPTGCSSSNFFDFSVKCMQEHPSQSFRWRLLPIQRASLLVAPKIKQSAVIEYYARQNITSGGTESEKQFPGIDVNPRVVEQNYVQLAFVPIHGPSANERIYSW